MMKMIKEPYSKNELPSEHKRYQWNFKNDLTLTDKIWASIDLLGIALIVILAFIMFFGSMWLFKSGIYSWIWFTTLFGIALCLLGWKYWIDFEHDYMIKVAIK